MRVAHISDPHFGRIASAHVQENLIDSVRAYTCDAILVTGDLTQRARRSEFRAAKEFIEALPEPQLVIPGNHDVHAWWHRPDLRIFNPLRRYKRKISVELEPELVLPGLAVLGLNTAHGLTVKSGRCTSRHLARIRNFFAGQLPGTLKILAVHHPLSVPKRLQTLDIAHNGERVLATASENGVDVICAGHWHLAHTEHHHLSGSGVLLSLAGTATSDRWRAPQLGVNSWNLIEKTSQWTEIRVYAYDRASRVFQRHACTRYHKNGEAEIIP